jgi:predicted nuclease with RNAse H fold
LKRSPQTVVGIDVGGTRKGFHAVALRNGRCFERIPTTEIEPIVAWCLREAVSVVAIDAPCKWSTFASSRLAERELMKKGIHCFFTPTEKKAKEHKTDYYGWVFNGQRLFKLLAEHRYSLFDGISRSGPACFETFPHAIVCALTGKVIPAKRKVSRRRRLLRDLGYDVSILTNIDFVDAALCAHTAYTFQQGLDQIQPFGNSDEGYILIPKSDSRDKRLR